jgi:predicted ATPase
MSQMSKAEILKAGAELAAHAVAIRTLGKRALSDIVEIGRHLIAAKDLAGHGNWLPWLEREFGWTDQTARMFMNVTEAAAENKNFLDWNVPISALYLLAAPSTPPQAIAQIAARSEAGERVSLVTVRQAIRDAKPPTVVRISAVRPPDDDVKPEPNVVPFPESRRPVPDPDPPRRGITIDEAAGRIRVRNMQGAKEIVDGLAAFGMAADPDKLKAITEQAAQAQAYRQFDAPAIRRVVEAILAGLDHPKDYRGSLGLDPPKQLH